MRLVTDDFRSFDIAAATSDDTAVAGANVEFSMFARGIWLECKHLAEHSIFTCLWGIKKFYDSISIRHLCNEMRTHGFPAEAGALALWIHRMPRRFKMCNCFGDILQGFGRSIVAGCTSSTSLARVLLKSSIERCYVASTYKFQGFHGVHVDDVSQTTTGAKGK